MRDKKLRQIFVVCVSCKNDLGFCFSEAESDPITYCSNDCFYKWDREMLKTSLKINTALAELELMVCLKQ